jgi:lactoylglutathione lyase
MARPIHSMIRVLDEARSVAFYRACLGLEIGDRYAFDNFTLIYLRDPSGPFELELTVNAGRTEPYNTGDGYGHLAVAVDDLDEERSRMEAAGASPGPVRDLMHDGALLGRFFFVKDPDDYSIEVLQRGGRFG